MRVGRTTWVGVGVLTVSALLVLTVVNLGGGDMTPAEAKQQVTALAEDTIAYAAPGHRGALRQADGLAGSCFDSFGRADNSRLSRSYTWEVQNIDDALADQIVARTDELWRGRGFRVRHDTATEGVTVILASDEDSDFGYRLTVNRNEGFMRVGGQTPCLEETPA